ncbi:MarR family transcriptional regulator [Actinomadura sp. J1-007]|nr:MarR family transcriptional regulator [Actinomadura sp. J1-007]
MGERVSTESPRAALAAALYDEERAGATGAVLYHAAVAAHLKINITDVSCVGVLDKEGPMTAGRLAQRVGVSRGGPVTAMIDRLESAGFLRRRRDPVDRRRVLIELVREDAYQRLQRSLGGLTGRYTELIGGYTEDELRLLLDFSRRTNEILHEQTTALQADR